MYTMLSHAQLGNIKLNDVKGVRRKGHAHIIVLMTTITTTSLETSCDYCSAIARKPDVKVD